MPSRPSSPTSASRSDVDSCSHSVDGGLTWTPSVPDPNLTCLSLFGHVKVSADGTAYIPSANCFDANNNADVGGIISTDNGQSLSGYAIPGAPTPADGFDPSVATDNANRVYESWSRAGDYQPVVTWSDDHGKSWAPQVDLGADPACTNPLDRRRPSSRPLRATPAVLPSPSSAPPPARKGPGPVHQRLPRRLVPVRLRRPMTAAQTWHTDPGIDPNPVQRGEIDAGGTTTSGQRNLLDFMDASLTKDGRSPGGLRRRVPRPACDGPNGTEAQSTDRYATVAYQGTGARACSAAYDVVAGRRRRRHRR